MKTKKKPARKRSQTDGLSKAELKLITELLEMATDVFSNHGCNDYAIPATDENRDILREVFSLMYEEYDLEDSLAELEDSKDELSVPDCVLFEYFALRCGKLAEKK